MPTELPELPDDQSTRIHCHSLLEQCLPVTALFCQWQETRYVWWWIRGVDTHWTGCTVQAELCAHYETLPKEPELLRGLRLHWRREIMRSG
jgi:hypothetical protein